MLSYYGLFFVQKFIAEDPSLTDAVKGFNEAIRKCKYLGLII